MALHYQIIWLKKNTSKNRKFPNFYDRLIAINLWRIGTPYGIFCLGEENGFDKDPIIRIDTSDCTVHVLTTLAFAESESFNEARGSMIKLHYKPDKNGKIEPTYKSRWHFTSDRLLNHPRTTDITSAICSSSDLETVEIELNRKENIAFKRWNRTLSNLLSQGRCF